jgi:LacI family transcriptional regulator
VTDTGSAQAAKSRQRRDPTILDLARAANVSKTTASRVLNGAPNVAPPTRARVLEAIKRIDYRVNTAARSLRTTRTFLVGLLVPAINNDVFGRIAEVLEEELRHDGVGLVIASSGWDAQGERIALESLRQRRVDALVLSLVSDRDPAIGAVLAPITRPIVLLDREVKGIDADVVLTDERSGIAEAVSHLHSLGHRTIGVAHITASVRPGREVGAGFRQAIAALSMESAGEIVVEYGRIGRQAGREMADRLTQNGATAILACVPTSVTAGVLERLDELGLAVPNDISLIAFDDSELASVMRPPLTVISRPLDKVSRFASRLVTSRLLDPRRPARVELVGMQLLVRASTAAPPVRVAQVPV